MVLSISFDRVASIYDATRGFSPEISEQITECILHLVSATPDTRFFEPGIGTGRMALPLVKKGYAYTGVDISEQMMAKLRQRLEGVPNQLTLLQADVTSLPLDDDLFDVALTVHLLHLIPAWREALAEIRRVLKPSGILLFGYDNAGPYARRDFDRQWQVIVAKQGFQLRKYGATKKKVLETLVAQGATLETVTAAQWRIEQTVGELLNTYEGKVYSSSWQIPKDVFSTAIQELREWAVQNYGSEEAILSADAKFDITVVRGWAAG